MRIAQLAAMAIAAFMLSFPVSAQDEGQTPPAAMPGGGGEEAGQNPMEAGALEASVTTSLTWRSHSLAPFQQSNSLEGQACPAPQRMISGACHPGFSDRVIIVNQYPNRFANTWRCGFKNNNNTQRTIWIYTLCGQ